MIYLISNNVVGVSVMGVGADIIVGSPVLEREREQHTSRTGSLAGSGGIIANISVETNKLYRNVSSRRPDCSQ